MDPHRLLATLGYDRIRDLWRRRSPGHGRKGGSGAHRQSGSVLAHGLREPVKTVVSRWGEHGPRPEPAAINDALFGAFEATASVEVTCAPMAAWQLVTDIVRIGEFSPECADARWIDGATFPAEGARFEGTNRVVNENHDSEYIWIRPCTVIVAQSPEEFAYAVGDRSDGSPAAVWDFRIAATATGCRVTQQFRHLPHGLSGLRLLADAQPTRAETIVGDRVTELTDGMHRTLQQMRLVLESNT
jgi:Polyketide cyclase / dehydrase and lipid transport